MLDEHDEERPDPEVDPYGARLWDIEEELLQQRALMQQIPRSWVQTDQYQAKVLIAGLILIILTGAFPPWTYTFTAGSIYSEVPAGYSFIANPPKPREASYAHGVKLDFVRLLVQWVIVATATALGMVLLSKRSS